MNHTHNSIVYTVNSDLDDEILYAEFDTKEEAIEYAKPIHIGSGSWMSRTGYMCGIAI